MQSQLRTPARWASAGVIAVLALIAPLQAFATLAGDEASIDTDRVAMAGTAAATSAAAGYTVKSYTLPSTTVVREFLAPAGTVFAVAWEGPMLPDLQQLLGSTHFATLDSGARERNREGRRGPMELQPSNASGLVVESTGHMRAFVGRAYLKSQVPAGVDTDAIR